MREREFDTHCNAMAMSRVQRPPEPLQTREPDGHLGVKRMSTGD